MLFLLPIPVSLVIAMLWAWWVSRPPRPVDPVESVEKWTRAIGALAPPAPRRAPDDELAGSR